MSTFDILARRVIAEAQLGRYGVSSEAVLPWLRAKYLSVIGHMPYGEATRQAVGVVNTTVPYVEGTVALTQNSATVVGVGTTFTSAMTGRQLRVASHQGWYTVTFVDTTHLTLDAPWSHETLTDTTYTLAQRFVTAPTGVRWVTQLRVPSLPWLAERDSATLDAEYPERPSMPAAPLWYAKVGWTTTVPPRRVVELYPAPDKAYRIEFVGFGNIDEPTLASSPLPTIDDQVLVDGGLADAFDFVAGQQTSVEMVRAMLDVAKRHSNTFDLRLRETSANDQRDMAQPRIRVVTRATEARRSLGSQLHSAWWEIWRR